MYTIINLHCIDSTVTKQAKTHSSATGILHLSIFSFFQGYYKLYIVYDGNFFKDWCKSMWHKKKIYWAILPHVFDQATDLGIIAVYYDAWRDYQDLTNEQREERTVNPFWFFLFGLIIIGFQRVVSSITIYFMTHNIKAAALQFLDLLIVKAIWVNYVLGLKESCNPQRYIESLVKYRVSECSRCKYRNLCTCLNRKPFSSRPLKSCYQWVGF